MAERPGEVVRGYLLPDEIVVFDERPSLVVWAFEQSALICSFLLTAAIVVATGEPLVERLGQIGLVVMAASFVRGLFRRLYTRYVLTDLRAIRVSGVLRRDHEWITWRKVTDVSVRRTLFDRMADTAAIHIQSANEEMAFAAMTDVPRPMEFARMVIDLVDRTNGRPEIPVA